MAQEKENYASKGEIIHLIPKASTDITGGDVVVMPRTGDPVSVAALGATPGRIEPIAAAREGQWMVGVSESTFKSALDSVGATLYATPTQAVALPVRRKGIFSLAITNTSGKEGDCVRYSSGGTGVQLFVIDNQRPGYAIARIWKNFSGATANDPQACELVELPLGGPNIYHWLENKVLTGCEVYVGGTAGAGSENVSVGYSNTTVGKAEKNVFLMQNRVYSVASDLTLNVGDCSVTAAGKGRFRWVVARSGGFGTRTCSGLFASATGGACASYTGNRVSALHMVPTTLTAGELPICLLVNFSKPQSYTAGLMLNIRGPGLIPRVGSWGI